MQNEGLSTNKQELSNLIQFWDQLSEIEKIKFQNEINQKIDFKLKMHKQELSIKLDQFEQSHLIQFWEELNEVEKTKLQNEIQKIDFKDLNEKFLKTNEESQVFSKLDSCMKPIPSDLKGSYQNSTPEQLENYESKGLKAISDGKVAVILLAGGQGTRLGVNYPKGMYSVGLPSKKTLFQLQAERLIRAQELASKKFNKNQKKSVVPWYVMTSENTHEMIQKYFEENKYFGLESENMSFFEQGTLPCLTKNGKLLLDQKNKISRAPDGNGGLYKALLEQNILDDMEKRGIEYVHIYCVDNILIRIADPVFIGFCIEKKANCAAKVVRKIQPEESVGVICKVNDQFQVVEYSEISEETRNLRDTNGDLTYNAGNICNHFLTFDFLGEVCKVHEKNLKHHIAEKKINYIDESGMLQKPNSKNGIKLEKFIFDIFPFSNNFAIWEVVRRDEFSPLKNGTNEINDNEITCRKHILEQHSNWIENAGIDFENLYKADDSMINFEISPLISYAGEGLKINNFDLKDLKTLKTEKYANLVLELDTNDSYVLLGGEEQIKAFYEKRNQI